MKKMCHSVQRFISHLEDHCKEEEKKPYYKRDLCPAATEAELVVECLCDVFLGED